MNDSDQREGLLRCPMCGHHAALMFHWCNCPGATDGLSDQHCYVQCENGDCCLELDQDMPKDKAIALWNTRAIAERVVTDEMVMGALSSGPIPDYCNLGQLLKKAGIDDGRDWMRAALEAAMKEIK